MTPPLLTLEQVAEQVRMHAEVSELMHTAHGRDLARSLRALVSRLQVAVLDQREAQRDAQVRP